MSRKWERTASQPIEDYRIFRLRKDTCVSPRTGRAHDFLVLETPDWINVVALTEEERVVFIRQFRFGTGRVTLEIPGGLVDPGEEPGAAAARELIEETGYAAARWTSLGSIEPNPAFLTNRCHTFLAEGARKVGEPHLEEREDIATEEIALGEVPRLLATGEISHALVAVAFQRLDLFRRGLLVP